MGLNNKVDTSDWIILTEKDSPYYGKPYDSLSDFQKAIHDQYVNGEHSKLKPEALADLKQRFSENGRKINIEYIKTRNASFLEARKPFVCR